APSTSSGFSLAQTIANGTYQVYLWEVEDGADHSRTFDIHMEGATVATGIGDHLAGQWSKYGPYTATVNDGVLNIDVVTRTGVPQLMGLAIFTAPGGAPPPTTYSIAGTVTAAGAGVSGVTVSAVSSSATTAADGSYTISSLAAGPYTLSASKSRHTFTAPHSVTLGPNQP